MAFCLNFPLFLIVLSFICAAVSSVLSGRAARACSLSLTAISFAANTVLFRYAFAEASVFTYMMGHYPHPWGNELRIGPLEAFISLFFSLVLFLCLLGGKQQLAGRIVPEKQHYFYVMTDLIQASLLALIYTNDLFSGYVFIEICTLSSCGILMIRRTGHAILASVRYMIFSLVGSGLFLLGVIILYSITGHLLMPNLRESIGLLWESGAYHLPLLSSICLISIGLAVKSGLFPFHLWMADTYGVAVPASSGILSGLISKVYIFFLLKLIYDVFGLTVFYDCGIHHLLYVMGAAGIITGSVSAMRENNIFRMIAFSSAAQIGYIYMGIGLRPEVGVLAALFQILAHAVTKPALFLSAGQLSAAAGKAKRFHDLQGAAYENPAAGAAFTAAAFSMIGLPFTMGFMAKFLFGTAAFQASRARLILTLLVLALSTILNTLYFARTVLRLYNKPQLEAYTPVCAGSQLSYVLAGSIFFAVNLLLGTLSQPLIELLTKGLQLL